MPLAIAAVATLWAWPAAAQDEPGGPRQLAERETLHSRGDVRPFRLGLVNAFNVGFGGELDNPSSSYHLGADLAFPTGRSMRYHLELTFQDLNGHTGLRFAPLTLGYEIPIRQSFLPPSLSLTVEVLLSVIQADVLFDSGYTIALSSGLRAAVMLSYDTFFFSLVPIGFELRYAYGTQDVGIRTGLGANWPFYFVIGVEL